MKQHPIQLSLPVSLQDETRFTNFYVENDANALVVRALNQLLSARTGPSQVQQIMIWGGSGSGLSHLLQASCHEAFERGLNAQYLPLKSLLEYEPQDIFDGMECNRLICLDGIEFCVGTTDWELALFHFYNKLRDAGHALVIAANLQPNKLQIQLPDLKSRLFSSPVYHVKTLSDEGKHRALMTRASERGMVLSSEVARYILERVPRDPKQLFTLLNTLDEASLREQRKLSIPFVRSVIEGA